MEGEGGGLTFKPPVLSCGRPRGSLGGRLAVAAWWVVSRRGVLAWCFLLFLGLVWFVFSLSYFSTCMTVLVFSFPRTHTRSLIFF